MPKKEVEKTVINRKEAADILNRIYQQAVDGIPKVSKSVDELACDYLDKYSSVEDAAKSFINYQIAKCGTSGFLSGLGGLITLPVTVPANVGSVLYIQLRMIATIAFLGGYDIHSDQVQTLAYICLSGTAASDLLKQTGINIGAKVAKSAIEKIPGKVLMQINQKVGFRLLTKMGEKGVINLIKMVPLVGGVIGATIDITSTKVIAWNAYRLFIKKMPIVNDKKKYAKEIKDVIIVDEE